MMRWVTILLLCLPVLAGAQSADELRRLAEEELKAGRYESAIVLFQDALIENEMLPEAYFGLAESYRLVFAYSEAERNYRKVRNTWPDRFPLSVYYYALMLKFTGNAEAAVGEFRAFISLIGDSGRYPDFLEQAYVEKAGAEMALALSPLDSLKAVHLPEPVNSPFNDFSPFIDEGGRLIITSGRVSGWTSRRELRYGEGFMDFYAIALSEDQWNPAESDLIEKVNGKFHEGNGTFSADGSKFYFSSCGSESVRCQILVTVRDNDGNWGKPVPLNVQVNLPGYDAKQPALSKSGDTLFFVSDRPGGKGMNDIWMTVSSGRELWRRPENLKRINTEFNEVSPQPLGTDMLLFASDGHLGYGGLDIFVYDLSARDTVVVNPGEPLNSGYDDAYAKLDGDQIFYASNRDGGSGNFDVYSIRIDDAEMLFYYLLQRIPTALRSRVSRNEESRMEEARKNLAEDPFGYESLTERQKQLINEVIRSKRAGRELPSELDYLSGDEKEFILKMAEERMKRREKD